jgi:hypothetical protein
MKLASEGVKVALLCHGLRLSNAFWLISVFVKWADPESVIGTQGDRVHPV